MGLATSTYANMASSRGFPASEEFPVVHGVVAAGTGAGEVFGFLLISASQRQDLQSESLLWREPVVKATQPLLLLIRSSGPSARPLAPPGGPRAPRFPLSCA